MTEQQLSLTGEERELLTAMLRNELKVKRVQEHRADSTEFKHIVAHQEELIEGILNKLGGVAVAPTV